MTSLAPPASPLSVASVAQLTLSLLAIVALIVAVSWVLKRLKMAGPRGRGGIAVLDELALGPRERIVLVRVGDAQVLVGISAAGMVELKPLGASIGLSAAPVAPAFAERLREFMSLRAGSR